MKRLFTLIVALLTLTTVSAQNQLAERNPWWWGADFGGSFQTSDMQPRAGFTFGISAAKYTRVSARSPIYLGLRFRFTDGRNFGYNYNRLDVSNNPVLNSGSTNYASDPANAAGVFSNYRFRYDELGADLIIGSNTLRKRGVLLYGFGGAAFNYWQTKTNLLDASGNLYDYSAITDAGDKDLVGDQLDNLLDETYETNADGSVNGGQWSFMPSAGFGFGYEWRAFAIGMEHRTTFALNDVIDGTRYNQVGQLTPDNDMYHYTGLFLRWRFGTTSSSTTTNNNPPLPPTPVVTNTPPVYTQTPPVVTDPDPVQTNPNNNPNLSVLPPPQVDFTVPSTNPYTATTVNQQLTVRVLNVLQQSQISLTINGQTMPQSAFNFNPTSHLMTFSHTLQPGNNTYYVVATNSAGSDNDNQTIIFKSGSSSTGVPPQVTFTNPATSPVTWTQPSQIITATTQNVAAAANVQITQNGLNVTNFTFNPTTGVVTFPANLQNGSNLYQITVTNTFGMANDATTILYNNVPAPAKPVVTITNPASCPHSTKVQNMTITATVTNVTAANQVSVVFNGAAVTNFSFALNGTVATISFPVVLNSGVNNLTITGTNAAGSDIKTCQITYKPQSPTVQPPVVTITSPAACPYTSKAQNMTITATVTNVTAASQISVLFNGTAVTNFSFALNGTVATISFPVVLNNGANNLSITGTNAAGSDAETCQITYKGQSPVLLPPDVTITNPGNCPHNTKNQNMTITATVTNVTAANQVNVVFNGTTISNFGFSLNGTTATISFPVTLNTGNNAVSITGTNSVGSDVAECQIIYSVLVPTVNPPKVTITNPGNCPHNTKSKSMTITATVTNVTAANQVNVVFNGTTISNFTFTLNGNVATVSFPASLNAGNNTVMITGTNSAGTDSKDCQIIYTVLVPTVNPPVVTYTVPASNPYTSTTPNVSVTANVTNVTAANQVTVSVNNVAVTNFGFTVNGSNATVTFPVAINMGQNISCVVTGTNTAGTDSEQMTIMYHPLAPAVNITNPASSPYTSTTAAYTFTATVLNVGSAAEITVLVNNAQVSGFNYNMSSKVLTYSTTLNPGTTTFEVRASNAGGNASDNASVIFKQAPPRGPRVTITTPANSPSNSASATANVVATVQYVQSASEITVKRSNNTTVNFNYSGTTLTFTDNLNNGANTYTITAANANGSDSKSTTINYTAPAPGNGDAGRPRSVPASDPVIQLVTPGTLTVTTSDQSYDVTMRTLGITSSSQITVKVNGVTASSFNYAASTNTLTFTANLNNGVNTINVRIQNSVGYAEKELIVTFTAQSRNSGGSGSSSGDSKNTSKPKTTTEKPKTTTTTTTEKPKTTTTTTPATTTPRGGQSTTPKAGETPAPKQEAPAPKAPRL